MIRIDDTLLEEIGLIALPKTERDQLLRQIYETLEMRVGMRLAERMTDQQLDEFEKFIDTNDEAGALKWLETNFPDYKQVVADELEKLKGEIKKDSDKIMQTMQAQGGQSPAPELSQPQQPTGFGSPTTAPASPVPTPFQPSAPRQSVAPQQGNSAAVGGAQSLPPLPGSDSAAQDNFAVSQPLTPVNQNDNSGSDDTSAAQTNDDSAQPQPPNPPTAQGGGIVPPPPGA